MELKDVGSKSTILLWCCFYWFRINENFEEKKLTELFFYFYSTCSVADGGSVRSVYNDRDVR